LIDHPVEMGVFTHATFETCGVKHHVVLTGRHRADVTRLTNDLQKVCETQNRLFEPETAAAPMSEYWFLITVVGDGFGGLEHRASTALIVSRDELPLANEPRVTTGYRKLLSLASHEYFHTWNVKRILPARFAPYDLTQENYTKQLWFFEGFTDYYDDLMLVRSGVITVLEYLELEADGIGRVLSQAVPSRVSQSRPSMRGLSVTGRMKIRRTASSVITKRAHSSAWRSTSPSVTQRKTPSRLMTSCAIFGLALAKPALVCRKAKLNVSQPRSPASTSATFLHERFMARPIPIWLDCSPPRASHYLGERTVPLAQKRRSVRCQPWAPS
jgi:hypothetical protein